MPVKEIERSGTLEITPEDGIYTGSPSSLVDFLSYCGCSNPIYELTKEKKPEEAQIILQDASHRLEDAIDQSKVYFESKELILKNPSLEVAMIAGDFYNIVAEMSSIIDTSEDRKKADESIDILNKQGSSKGYPLIDEGLSDAVQEIWRYRSKLGIYENKITDLEKAISSIGGRLKINKEIIEPTKEQLYEDCNFVLQYLLKELKESKEKGKPPLEFVRWSETYENFERAFFPIIDIREHRKEFDKLIKILNKQSLSSSL